MGIRDLGDRVDLPRLENAVHPNLAAFGDIMNRLEFIITFPLFGHLVVKPIES